ncbi:GntR family transcriptional regulator [Erysipelothrix anatis]|uniref:GntR family transcriptional regulator n=1 Tax=Erysipelothrix anatis TaxID=2683713 RepID=UPI001359013C|nr:GntR family transcriptional regulator [Erysipelothrix anatis]
MSLNKSTVAIYRQIIDYFQYEIASGRAVPGERIDSIRNLALKFKVNPNTVQKGLTELERDGFIITDRTNGKFVTEDEVKIQKLKQKLTHDLTVDFVQRAKDLNIGSEALLEAVTLVWEE